VTARITGGPDPGHFTLGATTCHNPDPIDHLLITTKAYDARGALAEIAPRLSTDCQALLMVNGMGLVEELECDHPALAFFLGTTTEGAYRTAPLEIHHAGSGVTHIGSRAGGPPPMWFRDWTEALPDCVWHNHIEAALWRKLAINCTINPLTAVHGCCNGELGRRPELIRATTALCTEIQSVCRAAGFADKAGTLHRTVAQVIAATADNRSSMLQDLERGHRTEIAYITGYLLKVADRFGIPAPGNRELMAAILAREASAAGRTGANPQNPVV
jgi:2-dehydropantoate 2-reductase